MSFKEGVQDMKQTKNNIKAEASVIITLSKAEKKTRLQRATHQLQGIKGVELLVKS